MDCSGCWSVDTLFVASITRTHRAHSTNGVEMCSQILIELQVMHLKPRSKEILKRYSGNFPATVLDIQKTGFYMFPMHPRENVIKIATHSTGYPLQGVELTEDLLKAKLKTVVEKESVKFRKFIQEYIFSFF